MKPGRTFSLFACFIAIVACTTINSKAQDGRIGWNYVDSTNLGANDRAGAPSFEQTNWNNHPGSGQAPGNVPLVLIDDSGNATTASLSAWTLTANNSWEHDQTANPNEVLLDAFSNRQPNLTFSAIPFSSYSVIVYYGNNEGPSTSTLEVGIQSRTITTGNTAQSSYRNQGYIEGTDTNTTTPSNYALFEGIIGSNLNISLSGANNNGICAVQIIEAEAEPESTTPATPSFPLDNSSGLKPWQSICWNVCGPGEVSYDVYLWQDGSPKPAQPIANVPSAEFTPATYLSESATFHWQIITHLQSSGTLTSAEFSFTSGNLSGQPPYDISPDAQYSRTATINTMKGIDRLTTTNGTGYPIPDGTTLAFYGDSITDVFTYFDDLQSALQTAKTNDPTFPNVTVLNRGINGATTDDLLNLPDGDQFSGGSGPNPPIPFKDQVDADLAALAGGESYVAVLQIGINDVLQGDNTSKAVFKSRLEEMSDYVLNKGQQVVLVSPSVIFERPIADITDDGQFDDAGNAILNQYIAALEEIATARELPFINQRQVYLDISKNENFEIAKDAAGTITYPRSTGILNTDSAHPNPRGKELSSELAAQGIFQLFQQNTSNSGFSPQPTSVAPGSGTYHYDSASRILYATRSTTRSIENSLLPLAEVLAGELEMVTGIKPATAELSASNVPTAGDIVLEFATVSGAFASSEEDEDQSYVLAITDHVSISSEYFKGVAYGTATLLQAIEDNAGSYSIPQQTITDTPAAAYRTVMIDLARQPSALTSVKEVVRLARMYKLRYVHLHLTDDQNFTFPFTPVTNNLSNNFTYDRAELIQLSAYADARGVTLIPELDLPGHSSKLRASGYLSPSANDADVAAPANYANIQAIVDDMLLVFPNSPYFHIGGDESGAGEALVPFLSAMNSHLRGKPIAQKKRLLVWEGFHGSPTTELPATGNDRVIVIAWEHRYNTPWNLLNSGYQVVNASWKPLYIVGSGSTTRYPHVTQRMWSPEIIHSWDKNQFMHWQPGIPVFEGTGPSDPDSDDATWDASLIDKADQVIGGQILSWEQNERTIVRDLLPRLPVMADRLWNPQELEAFTDFETRMASATARALTIIKPVEILPLSTTPDSPVSEDYRQYTGNNVTLTLRNRTKIPATIRYEFGSFNNARTSPGFDVTPETSAASAAYSAPFQRSGGFGIRAQLYRDDNGSPIDGHAWEHFNNWDNRVAVTEYEIDRRPLANVPDFASFTSDKITRQYELPLFHGPYVLEKVKGQMFRSTLRVPGSGIFDLSVQASDGHATVYIDLNKDGLWTANERVITDSPSNDVAFHADVPLNQGDYQLRVDHASGAIGALLWVKLNGPGTNGNKDITEFITLPTDNGNPPTAPLPISPSDGASNANPNQSLQWSSQNASTFDVYFWLDGNTQPNPTQPTSPIAAGRASILRNSGLARANRIHQHTNQLHPL